MSETRKLAAILVSDIVGYSRLAGADEDRILARLRALRSDLVDPIISVHHGRVVKRTGDGVIIEFRSAVDSVRCAIEMQNGLAERNSGAPADERIEYRVGIHVGDVVEESDGDLMGDGVNIAARLEALSEPGGLCLSSAAYEQVRDRLKETFADLGEKQLKNIARPVRVFALSASAIATSQARGVSGERGRRPRPSSVAAIVAALAALVVAAGGTWWLLAPNRPASVAAKAPADAAHFSNFSIVVLPFTNLSGDPKQDYLVDALTDELTTGLARIRDTSVIARNTAMTFKGKPVDATAIGKELGVRYVLEGSVEPSGDQMRVNAQLIDAGSGAHLWAEQFDTPRADVLQTQDAIVTHLAAAMDFQLKQAEAARLKGTPAAKGDAGTLALRCDGGMWRARYIGKEADAAFALCEQALAIDPNNVRALQLLGIKFYVPVDAGVSGDPKGDLEQADELETKALALDPDNTWAHLNMGNVRRVEGRIEESVAEAERALALSPSNVDAVASVLRRSTSRGIQQKP